MFSFLSALTPLHQKISALVLQLPSSLSFDEAKPRLENLFYLLPDNFLYSIEGQHESWFLDYAVNCLKQYLLGLK